MDLHGTCLAMGRYPDRAVGADRPDQRAERGSVLAAVLLTVLVAILGVISLASRMSGSRLGSFAESDYQAAKEAAEYGFNELVAELNKPDNRYLLVTTWDKWQSVGASDLSACRIVQPPSNAPGANRIPGVSSNSVNSEKVIATDLKYALISYQAPGTTRDGSGSVLAQPVCPGNSTSSLKFGNLLGGSGTLQVRGSRIRNGAVASTYILNRQVHASPTPAYPSLNPILSLNTPLAAPLDTLSLPSSTATDSLSCSSDTTCSTPPTTTAETTYTYYPYTGTTVPTITTPLANGCVLNASSTAIDCRYTRIQNTSTTTNPITLSVYTGPPSAGAAPLLPVNIYLSGSDLSGNIGAIGSQDKNVRIQNSNPANWSLLRVFGLGPTPSCPGSQTVYPGTTTAGLNGLFLLLPRGTIANALSGPPTPLAAWVCNNPLTAANTSLTNGKGVAAALPRDFVSISYRALGSSEFVP